MVRRKVIAANGLSDIAETLIVSSAEDVVVNVRQPDGRLRAALLGSVRPLIVFLDDPARSALYSDCSSHLLGREPPFGPSPEAA